MVWSDLKWFGWFGVEFEGGFFLPLPVQNMEPAEEFIVPLQ